MKAMTRNVIVRAENQSNNRNFKQFRKAAFGERRKNDTNIRTAVSKLASEERERFGKVWKIHTDFLKNTQSEEKQSNNGPVEIVVNDEDINEVNSFFESSENSKD